MLFGLGRYPPNGPHAEAPALADSAWAAAKASVLPGRIDEVDT